MKKIYNFKNKNFTFKVFCGFELLRMLWLLVFLQLCNAIVFWNAPITGLSVPTLMPTNAFSYGFSFDSFGKNFTIVPIGRGCPGTWTPGPQHVGQILWFNGDSLPCTVGDVQQAASNAGAAGLYMASAIAEVQVVASFDGLQGGLFIFSSATIFPSQKGLGNSSGTLSPPAGGNQAYISIPDILRYDLYSSIYPAILSNCSVLVDPPTAPNPLWVLMYPGPSRANSAGYRVSGFVAIVWLGWICSVAVMCMAASKWSVFYVHEGGFKLSLAQIQMIFCFFGGFFMFMMSFGYGGTSPFFPSNTNTIQFFSSWPWGSVCTSAVILGLYFREISQITSSQSSGALNVMKWPAIIIIFLLWAALFSSGLVSSLDPPGGGPSGTSNFAFAFVIASLFVGGGILVFGSISLLISMRGTKNSAGLYRVIVSSLLVFAIMWSLGVLCAVWTYFLVETYQYGQYSLVCALTTLNVFPPFVCFVLVMSNFRISLVKEIEISKSGTSSTDSSRSSSSRSTSSSASTNDPVIEL